MNYEAIILEKSDGIATITLNRPEKLNALNDKMAEELPRAFDEVATDDSVNAVVITGAGRAFCAGADIQERFLGTIEKMKRGEINLALEPTFPDAALPALLRIEKPVIASINGPAAGVGCTLTLACDIRIASENARFGFVFVKRGITAEFGSTYFLPRLIGLGKTLELLLTGRIIDAEEAKEIGLVSQVVPADQLETATRELAKNIAESAPIAVRLTKKGIYQGVDADLSTQMQWEDFAVTMLRQTEDHQEAARAFLEKRQPKFKGR